MELSFGINPTFSERKAQTKRSRTDNVSERMLKGIPAKSNRSNEEDTKEDIAVIAYDAQSHRLETVQMVKPIFPHNNP